MKEPEELPVTLSTLMSNIINKVDFAPETGIVHHTDGVDILPSNSTLAGMEFALVQKIGRESVLKRYIGRVKQLYDYIIVDLLCA